MHSPSRSFWLGRKSRTPQRRPRVRPARAELLEDRSMLAVSVLDFESLAHVDDGIAQHGSQYEEDGFVLTNTGTTTTESGQLATWGTEHPDFPGSTSLFNNTFGGWTELWSATPDQTFSLLSIDLSELNSNVGGSIRFVGRLPDESFVSTRFTIDGVFGHETFSFPNTFTGLSSAYWVQQFPLHQFDNIVVATEDTAIDVALDVKPDNDQNLVNIKSQGLIAVAIYSTPEFNAATIDTSSLSLSGVTAELTSFEDVDDDGDLDLILHFAVQDLLEQLNLDLEKGQQAATDVELSGETVDGGIIAGFDTINFFLPGKDQD